MPKMTSVLGYCCCGCGKQMTSDDYAIYFADGNAAEWPEDCARDRWKGYVTHMNLTCISKTLLRLLKEKKIEVDPLAVFVAMTGKQT